MAEAKRGGFHALEERIHQIHDQEEKPAERKATQEAAKEAPRGEGEEKQAPAKK